MFVANQVAVQWSHGVSFVLLLSAIILLRQSVTRDIKPFLYLIINHYLCLVCQILYLPSVNCIIIHKIYFSYFVSQINYYLLGYT